MSVVSREQSPSGIALPGPRGICRNCKAPITWARTIADKKMPMNVYSSVHGDYIVIEKSPTPALVAKVPREADTARITGEPRFICHLDICRVKRKWNASASSATGAPRRAHTAAYIEANTRHW